MLFQNIIFNFMIKKKKMNKEIQHMRLREDIYKQHAKFQLLCKEFKIKNGE